MDRERELDWLTGLVDQLSTHREGGVAVIEGVPANWQSRLLDAAVELAIARGITVLQARGAELEHQLAFGGVRQLLARHLEGLSARGRQTAMRGAAAWAEPLLGPPGAAPRQLGDPLFGLTALVANLAERSPILLAIDDVHWLDESSTAFLAYLARRIAGQPIPILGTVRTDTVAGRVALETLTATADTLSPAPLSDDGVAVLLERRWVPRRRRTSPGMHPRHRRRPFLVEEVARALEAVPAADRAAQVEHIAPDSVARAVVDRIRRLPAAATTLAMRSRCSRPGPVSPKPHRSPAWTRQPPRARLTPWCARRSSPRAASWPSCIR